MGRRLAVSIEAIYIQDRIDRMSSESWLLAKLEACQNMNNAIASYLSYLEKENALIMMLL